MHTHTQTRDNTRIVGPRTGPGPGGRAPRYLRRPRAGCAGGRAMTCDSELCCPVAPGGSAAGAGWRGARLVLLAGGALRRGGAGLADVLVRCWGRAVRLGRRTGPIRSGYGRVSPCRCRRLALLAYVQSKSCLRHILSSPQFIYRLNRVCLSECRL